MAGAMLHLGKYVYVLCMYSIIFCCLTSSMTAAILVIFDFSLFWLCASCNGIFYILTYLCWETLSCWWMKLVDDLSNHCSYII